MRIYWCPVFSWKHFLHLASVKKKKKSCFLTSIIIPSLFQLISLISQCCSTLFSSFPYSLSLFLSISSCSIRVPNTSYISIADITTNSTFLYSILLKYVTWCLHRPTDLISNFSPFTILSKIYKWIHHPSLS